MKKNEQQATIRARNQLLSCIENFHQTCFKQNWIILRWNKYNTSKAHKWWQVGIRSKCITVPNKSKCLCVFFSFVCCYFLLYLYFSFPQIINEFCINSIKKFIMWTWSGTYLCYCSNCICICVLHVLCCVLVFVFYCFFLVFVFFNAVLSVEWWFTFVTALFAKQTLKEL